MHLTNKAIAKTVMRKPNFKTSNPKLTFERQLQEKIRKVGKEYVVYPEKGGKPVRTNPAGRC